MGYRKLQRTKSQRKALLRDLTTNLILNGKIQTTEARAKEVRRQAEKMITLGKRGDLAARRLAATYLRDVEDENK
ncbi:50S ribosomal protein L17, partial [Oenococcus oeni]